MLYVFDSEGNVAQRTDASASVVSDHLFNAHGQSLNATLTEPFGYRAQFGYYTDNETGLQLLTNRYYDPSTGRFLTRDPISYSGGINLYSYVRNNGANSIDPNGLNPGELAIPLGGLAGAGSLAGAGEILAGGAAIAGPAAAVVGVGAITVIAFWPVGEMIANQPWNPLTRPWYFDRVYPTSCGPLVIPKNPPRDREKEEECHQQCEHLLGKGGRSNQGLPYRNCYQRCMGIIE